MIFGCYFTRYKQLEFWEEMENRIHVRQYTECFLPTLVPAVGVSLWISWWFMLIPLSAYHFLYWVERMFRNHSIFDWEASIHCGDSLYLRKRKSYAWIKKYAVRHGAIYLDYYTSVVDAQKGMKAEYSEDGVHPNAAGYNVMEPLAKKAVKKALSRVK